MDNELTFIMLCGVPGCGKSTYAASLATKFNAKIVCLDTIREELYGDANILGGNEVYNKAKSLIKEYLEAGISVIYDATNTRIKSRGKTLRIVNDYNCKKIAIHIDTPLDISISRNNHRDRVVPKGVIVRFYNDFQEPTIDEGFDEVKIINNNN